MTIETVTFPIKHVDFPLRYVDISRGYGWFNTSLPGPLRIPMYVKIVGREVPFPLVVRRHPRSRSGPCWGTGDVAGGRSPLTTGKPIGTWEIHRKIQRNMGKSPGKPYGLPSGKR